MYWRLGVLRIAGNVLLSSMCCIGGLFCFLFCGPIVAVRFVNYGWIVDWGGLREDVLGSWLWRATLLCIWCGGSGISGVYIVYHVLGWGLMRCSDTGGLLFSGSCQMARRGLIPLSVFDQLLCLVLGWFIGGFDCLWLGT